jgi:predicted DNA-binding protein (MmcQ/YjbR family)
VKPSKPNADIARAEKAIAALAMAYPSVTLDHPWGHSAFKVRGKVFLFLSADADGVSLSVKLPNSADAVLSFGFAEPTGYGLGKSGWVTARFQKSVEVPMELVRDWLDESFGAIAPKKLLGTVEKATKPAARTARAAKRAPVKKKAPAKKKVSARKA